MVCAVAGLMRSAPDIIMGGEIRHIVAPLPKEET